MSSRSSARRTVEGTKSRFLCKETGGEVEKINTKEKRQIKYRISRFTSQATGPKGGAVA